jgi:FimV-like protein
MEGVSLDPEKFSIDIEDASRPNMKYRLERIDGDNATIVFYTRQMVTDPLVRFRLKVKWDKSAIARSYDIFIDPPSYGLNPAGQMVTSEAAGVAPPETSNPVAEEVSEPVYQPIAASSPVAAVDVESEVEVEISHDEAPAGELVGEIPEQRREYGPTIDGKSLWWLTQAVSTNNENLTIFQWMYGIWKANPQAFARSNMHRLNMGEMLSIPLEREIAEISRSGAWRAYGEHLAMLKPAVETREAGQEDVSPTSTVAGVEPAVADEADPVNGSTTTVPAASSPADFQESGIGAIDEPATVGVESLDEDAVNAATIANLVETKASIDLHEAEASIATGSFSSEDLVAFQSTDGILDLLKEAYAGPEAGVTAEQSVPAARVQLALDTGEIKPSTPAAGSLESRSEFVARLPVVGSGAPLAFMGRAWQRADEFISNSPGWASMAFGGWITLVISMLMQQFRFRRRVAMAAVQRSGTPAPLAVQAGLEDPVPVAEPVAAEESQAGDEPDIEFEVGSADEPGNSPVEGGWCEAFVAAEPGQTRVERGPHRRASDRRQVAMPVQPDKIDFDADEILQKANTFMVSGNSGEAVKLLELTVKLQPDRLILVLRLLEIYHKLEDAEAFEGLAQRFKPALEVMEISQQIDLQVMYSKLCPHASPLIDPGKATYMDDTDYRMRDDDEAVVETDNRMELLLCEQAGDFEADVEEDYAADQVIVFNNGVVLEEGSDAAPGRVGEAIDLEVSLQEIDVYLAYGLYGNAEELLHKVKAIYPGRADLMARLLDIYYATKNVVDFEDGAEGLKSTGDAADPYWEKVVIMGYELAPYNEMFAEGKDKSLFALELDTARPELPDFDLGAAEIASGKVSTDVDLQGDDLNVETKEITADDDYIDFDLIEGEIALDGDEIDMEGDKISMGDNELNLDSDEIGLDDDIKLAVDEVARDDADIDVAAALSETNLNLDVEAADSFKGFAGKTTGLEDDAVIDDDQPGQTEAVEKETQSDESSEIAALDGDEEIALELDDYGEVMKFMIPEASEAEQPDSCVSVRSGGQAAVKISERQDDEELVPVDSRILFFPDSGVDKVKSEQFEEFASEVRVTLQAIRDQLQKVTERQYRQERETHKLHISLAGSSGDSPAPAGKKSEKSS